jgi:hypothetical protein
MSETILIITEETSRRAGQFTACVDDAEICRSATPLLTTARLLAERGISGDTVLVLRHKGSNTIALRSTIAGAASLCVSEDGPRFRLMTEPMAARAWRESAPSSLNQRKAA